MNYVASFSFYCETRIWNLETDSWWFQLADIFKNEIRWKFVEIPHLCRSFPAPNSEIRHIFLRMGPYFSRFTCFLDGFLLASSFLRSKNATKNHGVVKLKSSLPSFLHLEVWLLTHAPWQNLLVKVILAFCRVKGLGITPKATLHKN